MSGMVTCADGSCKCTIAITKPFSAVVAGASPLALPVGAVRRYRRHDFVSLSCTARHCAVQDGRGTDGELRALNRRVRVQLRDLLLSETEKMHPDEQTALLQAVINRFAQAENDEALQDVMDSMRLHGRWA